MDIYSASHYPTVDLDEELEKLKEGVKMADLLTDKQKKRLAEIMNSRVPSHVYYLKSKKRIG